RPEFALLLKEMIDSWRKKFFNGEYLKYDEPVPGSVEFVNELSDSGALIIYLTGRDAPGTLIGIRTYSNVTAFTGKGRSQGKKYNSQSAR
ncbi:unnamed protein product, partial [marine sediment metagenome]